MTEILAGAVVAAVALVLVLEPLVRGRPWLAASTSEPDPGDVNMGDVAESDSPKIRALLALREIEFDRETGKLSEEDYNALKATYKRAALSAIEREEIGPQQAVSGTEVVCPVCGPRPEQTARFCSSCGRVLDTTLKESRVCSKCGAEVPSGAKFCGECGTTL